MIKRISLFLSALLLLSFTQEENFPGYTLIEKRFVKEVNADCYLLEHNKTGARIFKVASDDANKTFNIQFKTIPENDWGTPHVLEHSVLNGSKNFPVKSPFDVLLKGSLNTFLNAMTSSDATVYPAASLNEKDYFNLMNVYFDAVFYPLIYDDPMILQQEGWHYELTTPDDPLTIKGVVYNEMKGAFSSPDRYLYYYSNKYLFPDNTYGSSSGGYPDAIPNLTQEYFTNFHKTFYHPSNSYIFLYGDANLMDELTFIDTAYLSHFDKLEIDAEVPFHKPFDEMKEISEYYSVPEGSNTEGQTYIALSFVFGDCTDETMDMALNVLTDVLVNQESAPVRLALQKAGIGNDVYAWNGSTRQNVVQIVISNANPEDAPKAKEVIFSTLAEQVKNGLDAQAIEGTLNRIEFRLREGDNVNKGLTYSFMQRTSWMHANNAFQGIEFEKPLAAVKEGLSKHMLEDIIQKNMIDNPYKLLLTLAPKPGLENERKAKIEQDLAEYKSTLSNEEIDAIVASTQALLAKQNEEDSPEALATIPSLSLADISPETDWFEITKKDLKGNTVLHFNEFTNSILYANYLFDLRVLPEDMIPWIGIFEEFLTKLNTENYDYAGLEKALKINTGGFNTSLSTNINSQKDHELIPHFKITAKATMDKADKLFELTEEILLRTDFSDTARIRTVLVKHLAGLEADVKNNGFSYARKRMFSYNNAEGLFGELTSGIEYYWFVRDLVKDYANQADEVAAKMQAISELLFTRENLTMGITCSEEDYKTREKTMAAAFEAFPSKEQKLQNWALETSPKNEGFMAASKVQYVLQGADYLALGHKYSGDLLVMSKILNSDWLQKEVRIKGGAYGGFGYFRRDGRVFFGSYRDPNLKNTLDVYAAMPEYIRNYETDDTEMVRSIIGTIADLDYPETPSEKGNTAINRYYSGYTKAEAQTIRDEVLNVTVADIRALAPLLQAVIDKNSFCVYGSQAVIEENKELFDSVMTIVE
ncbi:MAG: insulinase family protein [Bacteroidales bacterium]|nr:insulinase family protein [Bacteroidales bacterium]